MTSGKNIGRQIALLTAERVRDLATQQGRVPFCQGTLRKAHVVRPYGAAGAELSVNTPYARRLHDGGPAFTIVPKKPGGRLFFWTSKEGCAPKRIPGGAALKAAIKSGQIAVARKVQQKATRSRPWLQDAIAQLPDDGLAYLHKIADEAAIRDITAAIQEAIALRDVSR